MSGTPAKGKPSPIPRQPAGKGGPTPAKKPSPQDFTIEGSLKQLLADQESEGAGKIEALPEDRPAADADAPLVRLVNCLIAEAIKTGTSDVHIEPFEGFLRVRYRIDGVLQEIQKVPHKLAASIASRLKIMADLDICEKRIPQDGIIRFSSNGMEADLRMSTLPSVFGEKIVMRVMGKTNLNNDLSKLGIPTAQLKSIRDAVHRPDGLVLVTGPTGSGKTTTLYAALNELNDIGVSVFTAEDPVEGTIPGVTQSQANPAIGFTFASILRSLLRQDPDVILVGEIRDQETAEISIKAALTGHLVLSTLHTNCAVSTISRLVNMGVAPYLIASAINCIVAQRLVRRICGECKEPRTMPPELLDGARIPREAWGSAQFSQGRGCAACHNSGFKGRAPIYEVLSLTDTLRRLVLSGASKADMKRLARSEGMMTLREAGLQLVLQGVTTLEEVLEVTNEDDDELTPPAPSPTVVVTTNPPAQPLGAAAPSTSAAPTAIREVPNLTFTAPMVPAAPPSGAPSAPPSVAVAIHTPQQPTPQASAGSSGLAAGLKLKLPPIKSP